MRCSWTRHCSLCASLYPDVQLKLQFNGGVGLASLSASFLHATDQSHTGFRKLAALLFSSGDKLVQHGNKRNDGLQLAI